MLFTDYDEQEHMACVKEEGFEEGQDKMLLCQQTGSERNSDLVN